MAFSTVLGTEFGDIPFSIDDQKIVFGKNTKPLSTINGFTYCLTKHDVLGGSGGLKRKIADQFVYRYLLLEASGNKIEFWLKYKVFILEKDQLMHHTLQGNLWRYIGDPLLRSVNDQLQQSGYCEMTGCTVTKEGLSFEQKSLFVFSKKKLIPWEQLLQSEENGVWTVFSAADPSVQKKINLATEPNAVVLKRWVSSRIISAS